VRISPKSIDRLLTAGTPAPPLAALSAYSTAPSAAGSNSHQVASDWDRTQVGNMQFDYVAHCGQSTAGAYLWTISLVDIAS
jgi:hypothetical protein